MLERVAWKRESQDDNLINGDGRVSNKHPTPLPLFYVLNFICTNEIRCLHNEFKFYSKAESKIQLNDMCNLQIQLPKELNYPEYHILIDNTSIYMFDQD